MKKTFTKLMAVAMVATLGLSSCQINEHVVGNGSQKGVEITKRQLYLFSSGLARLNTVDTNKMAGNATNYTIKTRNNGIDLLISGFTFGILGARTVTVTK